MTNIRPEITSYHDLMLEKKRLKTLIKTAKQDIGFNFNEMKDELNPFKNVSSTAKSLLSTQTASPLVSYGVASAANFLLRKVFLRNAGWLPRILAPIAVKKLSRLIVAPKLNDKIVDGLHTAADTIREADIKDILPDEKPKILQATSELGNKVADKLHDVAEKIRPADDIDVVTNHYNLIVSPLPIRKTNNKIAGKLRRLAANIRG